MSRNLMRLLVGVACLGVVGTVEAQTKPVSRSAAHARRTHSEVRHKSGKVSMPDDSKKMNSDLAKLESQTSRSIRPARRAPEKKAVLPHKVLAQQDRRSNPPINFNYSGPKTASAKHGGASSHGTAAPVKGPRIR